MNTGAAARKLGPTPGPWRLERSFDGARLFIVFGQVRVAEVMNDADAELLAAAPTLLATLAAVARELGQVRGLDNDPGLAWCRMALGDALARLLR